MMFIMALSLLVNLGLVLSFGRVLVDIHLNKKEQTISNYGNFLVFIKFQGGVTPVTHPLKVYCFFCVNETHRKLNLTKLCSLVGSAILYMDHPKKKNFV